MAKRKISFFHRPVNPFYSSLAMCSMMIVAILALTVLTMRDPDTELSGSVAGVSR